MASRAGFAMLRGHGKYDAEVWRERYGGRPVNGYGAVGDARKQMHPGDAAQHRANLEFSARGRAERERDEARAKHEALREAVANLADEWESALNESPFPDVGPDDLRALLTTKEMA